MKNVFLLLCMLAFASIELSARQPGRVTVSASSSRTTPVAYSFTSGEADAMIAADDMLQDDPAYARYKEGYNAILNENWSEARKKLAAVIDAYPKSDYRDDAEYWHAYALMHTDRKKAIEAYGTFVKSFPKSTYYDDAVSDLEAMNSGVTVISTGSGKTNLYVGDDGYAYSFTTDSAGGVKSLMTPAPARASASQLRALSRDLQRVGRTLPRMRGMAVSPTPPAAPSAPLAPMPYAFTGTLAGSLFGEEKLDPETQLKLDALYAIGDTKQDDKSYQALKNVALDFTQPERLRYAALDVVSGYEKFDVLSIYTEIARKDTNQEMQSYAVDYISNNAKDKNKSVLTLIDLFNATPKSRVEQKQRIFFAIAEVGNDRAVDFLSTVARTNENYDLRREAVFYLGTMGSEKARSALYDILQGGGKR